MIKYLIRYLIKFYQKYLSILFAYGCCRYYPTCSEYAMINFKHNNIFLASFNTIIRILKCNPIFDIGFDYPVIYSKIEKCIYINNNIVNIKKENIVFFLIPIIKNNIKSNIKNNKKNKFFIIKKI